MNTPMYDPPYESPLEDLFAWNAVKYLGETVAFDKQVEVDTICGKFRLDFLAVSPESRVAFECDGVEYHEPRRDEWRDAMILGANAVDVIYHLRGTDLYYHLEDCLFIISKWNPELFSHRGLIGLERLTSQHVKNLHLTSERRAIIEYNAIELIDFIDVRRTVREEPEGVNSFWKNVFQFAQENGGGNLDEIIEKFHQ